MTSAQKLVLIGVVITSPFTFLAGDVEVGVGLFLISLIVFAFLFLVAGIKFEPSQTSTKTKVFIALLLIVAALFYWFQWRPSEARKECARLLQPDQGTFSKNRAEANRLDYETKYKDCLNQRGVKP